MAKRRLSERRRRELLEEFEASGLTAAAFCRAHGLGYQSFLSWRRASAKKSRTLEAPCFVEVELAPTAGSCSESQRQAVAELDLGTGVILRVYPIQETRS